MSALSVDINRLSPHPRDLATAPDDVGDAGATPGTPAKITLTTTILPIGTAVLVCWSRCIHALPERESSCHRRALLFPVDPDTGHENRTGVRGTEYMRHMRAWIQRAGVKVLDHSPALELLVEPDGSVRGAAGYQRHENRDYSIVRGAVVLAGGGCAFLSHGGSPPTTFAEPYRLNPCIARGWVRKDAAVQRYRGAPRFIASG
jgi:hypothetical protein